MLKWTRVQPGVYQAGDYRVGHLETGEWFAEGPNVDAVYSTKRNAQSACKLRSEVF